MKTRVKALTLAMLAVSVSTLLATVASAQQLAGTYRISEGDEIVTLTYSGTTIGGSEIYGLTCNGVFTSSTGTLTYNPGTNGISVNVTPVRNTLGLALWGNGWGQRGFGRTLTIQGLTLDNIRRTLHFQ